MSLSKTIDKKLVFAFTQKATFNGRAFFDKFKTADFLTHIENIVKILSQGQELKKCLASVKVGDYVTIDGMFIKPGIPLVIRKSGREDETDVSDEEFTFRRLSGLTAAVATLHSLPSLYTVESEALGLSWKKDNLSQWLYLSAVSGTEYFVDHFDVFPYICALRKFQLNIISEETLIRIKMVPSVDGQPSVMRSRTMVEKLKECEGLFWGLPFKMSDASLFHHSPYSYSEETISKMKIANLESTANNQIKTQTKIKCVSSGLTNQGNSKYRGNGRQCTAMAAVAICYSAIKRIRSNISTFNFDMVLRAGDNLYLELEPNISADDPSRFLSGDEIPTEIKIGDERVAIVNEYLHTGTYPTDPSSANESISQLERFLTRVFSNDWNDDKDGAIFTGSGYSVAFWRYGRYYYIFNSHAVSTENKSCPNGVARIFQLSSVELLANALIEYNCLYKSCYELHKIRVERSTKLSIDEIKSSVPSTSVDIRNDNSVVNAVTLPSVFYNKVPNINSNSTKSSAGPVTKIRRTKWTLTNSHPYKKNP